MKATRDPSGNLVITNVEAFLAVLLLLCVTGAVAVWFAPVPTRTAVGWTALLGLFALALLSAQERSRFVFDRARGVLTWRTADETRIAGFQDGFSWLSRPDLVSIAAVQGHAIGAGFQLALACDLRIAAEGTVFAMAETGLGIVIHTQAGPVPITTAYTGVGDAAEQVGEAVRAYLAEIFPSRDLPFIKA